MAVAEQEAKSVFDVDDGELQDFALELFMKFDADE